MTKDIVLAMYLFSGLMTLSEEQRLVKWESGEQQSLHWEEAAQEAAVRVLRQQWVIWLGNVVQAWCYTVCCYGICHGTWPIKWLSKKSVESSPLPFSLAAELIIVTDYK